MNSSKNVKRMLENLPTRHFLQHSNNSSLMEYGIGQFKVWEIFEAWGNYRIKIGLSLFYLFFLSNLFSYFNMEAFKGINICNAYQWC